MGSESFTNFQKSSYRSQFYSYRWKRKIMFTLGRFWAYQEEDLGRDCVPAPGHGLPGQFSVFSLAHWGCVASSRWSLNRRMGLRKGSHERPSISIPQMPTECRDFQGPRGRQNHMRGVWFPESLGRRLGPNKEHLCWTSTRVIIKCFIHYITEVSQFICYSS